MSVHILYCFFFSIDSIYESEISQNSYDDTQEHTGDFCCIDLSLLLLTEFLMFEVIVLLLILGLLTSYYYLER